jgi:hypothetical protein
MGSSERIAMPDKKGEPTLMEQFDEADAHAHLVSEGRDSLEAYRHLQKIEAEHAVFKDTIRHMAESAHQAYHHGGGWWDCPKNICSAAQKQLPDYVLWLSGKGPKP